MLSSLFSYTKCGIVTSESRPATRRKLEGFHLDKRLEEGGDFDEAFALADAVDHMRERFAVLLGEVQEGGIGRVGKRFFPQPEEFKVHARECSQ